MGLIHIVFTVVSAIVLIVVGLGAYLYFTDADVHAKITARDSGSACPVTASTCVIGVTPDLLPFYHYSTKLDRSYWQFACQGYGVDFHLQTHKITVKKSDGTIVYDSDHPPGLNTLSGACPP